MSKIRNWLWPETILTFNNESPFMTKNDTPASHAKNESIFGLNDLSDLAKIRNEVVRLVSANGFAIIRGVFERNEIRSKLDPIYDYINNTPPQPSSGVSKEQIRTNMIKWSIGSFSNSQSGISRFMLTVMNPMYQEDIFGLRNIFEKLIIVRDCLAERDEILFDRNLPQPKFNGTRLQLYPKGGGFMTAHVDTKAKRCVSDISSQYIQLVLLLTEKGTDYECGGAYVDVCGERVDTEGNGKSGDILVYDGATFHGVSDIDPHKSFEANNIGGRVVALATIYN